MTSDQSQLMPEVVDQPLIEFSESSKSDKSPSAAELPTTTCDKCSTASNGDEHGHFESADDLKVTQDVWSSSPSITKPEGTTSISDLSFGSSTSDHETSLNESEEQLFAKSYDIQESTEEQEPSIYEFCINAEDDELNGIPNDGKL